MEILKTGPYGLREIGFYDNTPKNEKLTANITRRGRKIYTIEVELFGDVSLYAYAFATKLGNKEVKEAAEWLLLMTQARMV